MFMMKQELRVNEQNTYVLATTVGLESEKKEQRGRGGGTTCADANKQGALRK